MTQHVTEAQRAVILVGHGGVPSDYPRTKVRELMTLEGQRQASGAPMGERERELDAEIRNHPRSPDTDPYKYGLEKLAAELSPRLGQTRLWLAFNEFCAPSVPDAVQRAVAEGAEQVVLISSMMTPGGSHSEVEIPELVEELREQYPQVSIRYAWPFDMAGLAEFMAQHLAGFTG